MEDKFIYNPNVVPQNIMFPINENIFDGTKTVVKCSEDDIYDPEKGFLLCYMKKVLGNKSAYNKVLHEATKINDEDIKESSSLVDKIGNAFKKAFNN